jgi:large subunit ribosomal protein L17
MRHNAAGRKLGRKTGHRLAMFRNQLASLVASERIVTTVAKAKELRPLAERIVTQGKRGTIHARRLVGRWMPDRELVKKLFDEIAPRFASRPGGYLRIVKLGSRQGDGAEMAILEFVDFQLKSKPSQPAAEAGKGRKSRQKEDRNAGESAAAQASPEAKKTRSVKAKPAQKTAGSRAAPKAKAKAAPKSPAAKKTSTPKKIGSS